jgi:resuscitation-promoting factor RpfA
VTDEKKPAASPAEERNRSTETPSLLRKPVALDRRTQHVPSFDELRQRSIPGARAEASPPSNVNTRQAPPSPLSYAVAPKPAAVPPASSGSGVRSLPAVAPKIAPVTAAPVTQVYVAPTVLPELGAPIEEPASPSRIGLAPTALSFRPEPPTTVSPYPPKPSIPSRMPAAAASTTRPEPTSVSPYPAKPADINDASDLFPLGGNTDEVPTTFEPSLKRKVEPTFDGLRPTEPLSPETDEALRAKPTARGRAPDAAPVIDVVARPAALWRRTFAWAIDLLVIASVVLGFLSLATLLIGTSETLATNLLKVAMPGLILALVLALVYTSLFAFLGQGRTLGRRLLGLHLVDGTGHAPGPIRAIARGLLALVSVGLFFAGFWLALFDRKGQTLHDKLARTYVVQLG